MAITVVSEPAEVVSRLPHVRWELSLPSGGSYPNIIRGFYRVEIQGVGYLSSKRKIFSAAGINIAIDPAKELGSFVANTLPDIFSNVATSVPESKILVRLEYGEYQYNVETQVQTELSVGNTLWVRVIDAARQFYEEQLLTTDLGSTVHKVMTRRPETFSVGFNQSDWIYVITNLGDFCDVDVYLYNYAGAVIYSTTFAIFSGQVGYVPIGGANFINDAGGADKSLWYRARVSFGNVFFRGNPLIYNIYYRNDICNGYVRELIFKEPIGGYSSLEFESVSINIDRAAGLFSAPYVVTDPFTDNLLETSGGLKISDLVNGMIFTYKRKFAARDANRIRDFLIACASAQKHYVKIELLEGDIVAIPGVVESSNIQTFNGKDDFEFTLSVRLFKQIVNV